MRLPDDNNITLGDANDSLIIDGSEFPAADVEVVAALLPRYAQEGDGPMRAAVLAAWRATVNFLWVRAGLFLAAQKSPSFADDVQLDAWRTYYQRARLAGEEDPPYRARLLTTVERVTPRAIEGVVRALVAEVTAIEPAFLEPAVDAAFCAPLSGCSWAAFLQPASRRLWAEDPTSINRTASAYVVPALTIPQFWVVVPGDAGDDTQAPHCLSVGASQAADPADFLGTADPVWHRQRNLLAARQNAAAVRLSDGRLLIIGGDDGENALASCEIYDPQLGFSVPTGRLAAPRSFPSAVLLRDGRVLVAGGAVTLYTPTGTCELYNPVTGHWTATGVMALGRFLAPLVLLQDGRALVVGGNGAEFSGIETCELFNPVTGKWSSAATLLQARSGFLFSTLLSTGHVLLAGGQTSASATATAECELFVPDAGAGRWITAPPMQQARAQHAQCLLADGTVLVAGGADAQSRLLGSAERFDERTGTWRQLPPVPYLQALANAAALGDGTVMLVGGDIGGGDSTTSCAIFDPITSTWRAAPSLQVGRYGSQLVQLAANQAVVVGGFNPSAARTVEVLAPVLTDWNYTPKAPDSLMERVRAEVELRRAGGVTWWELQDPLLQGAL